MSFQFKLRAAFGSDKRASADLLAHPLRQAMRRDRGPQPFADELEPVRLNDREEMARLLVLWRARRLDDPLLGERRLRHGVADRELAIENLRRLPTDAQDPTPI